MPDLISVADVITEFGAHYLANSTNKKNLTRQIFQDMVTPSHCTPMITDDTVLRLSKGDIEEVLQPYQDAFTKKGSMDFAPKEIALRQMKIDWEDNPSRLKASWLGFLAANDTDRKTWPFIKWLLEERLVQRSRQDRELLAYFKGVYAAPTPGTAGSAGTVMDGFKKLIDLGLADASMNEVTLAGGLTTANIFDQVEAFSDALPQTWAGLDVSIHMSKGWHKAYHRDKRNTLGVQPTYEKGNEKIDFDETKLVGLPSMANTDYIFATPKFNMIHATNRQKAENFQVEGSKRTVSIYSDWWEGVGFMDNDLVYAYAPAASGSGS